MRCRIPGEEEKGVVCRAETAGVRMLPVGKKDTSKADVLMNLQNKHALSDLCHSSPPQEPFEWYLKASGHSTEAKALAAHDTFGLNRVEVPVPPFASLLKDHLLAPFFCFQVRPRSYSMIAGSQRLAGEGACSTAWHSPILQPWQQSCGIVEQLELQTIPQLWHTPRRTSGASLMGPVQLLERLVHAEQLGAWMLHAT